MAHQTTVRDRLAQSFEGGLAYPAILNDIATLVNSAPQTAQVSTITVDTATQGATYTVYVDALPVAIVAVGATATLIAAEIATAINASPMVRGRVSAAAAVAVVTLTALNPGRSFVVDATADTKLTDATTTVNATASAVSAGRAVTASGWGTGTVGTDTQLGHVTAAALMTAQAWTFTGASIASGDTQRAIIHIAGVDYSVDAAFDTSNNASVAALATAINGQLPASSVAATSSAGVLTLTSEVAGLTFGAAVVAFGAGGGGYTRTSTALTPAQSYWAGFGVALRSYDEEQDSSQGSSYPGGAGMRVLHGGAVWVAHNGTSGPAAGADVYVYVGATAADRGKFYDSTGTDRVLVPREIAVWAGLTARGAGDLALLDLRSRRA